MVLWRIACFGAAVLLAANAGRIARWIDNQMLFARRINRRDDRW